MIVGPEKPLVEGLIDFLDQNIKVFGPRKNCSIKGSNIYKTNLWNLKYQLLNLKFVNQEDAFVFLSSSNFPLVVKADVLAAGKGVYICQNVDEANCINEIFDGKFGKADQVLIKNSRRWWDEFFCYFRWNWL